MEVSMSGFDVHAYLRSELKRYFPDAKIDVHEGDEVWDIGVRFPDTDYVLNLHMDVGSDDDCFRFTAPSGNVFTVPIPQELSA
jgi:hypothetical protein